MKGHIVRILTLRWPSSLLANESAEGILVVRTRFYSTWLIVVAISAIPRHSHSSVISGCTILPVSRFVHHKQTSHREGKMFVQVIPLPPVAMIDGAERVGEKLPDLWPRLERETLKEATGTLLGQFDSSGTPEKGR